MHIAQTDCPYAQSIGGACVVRAAACGQAAAGFFDRLRGSALRRSLPKSVYLLLRRGLQYHQKLLGLDGLPLLDAIFMASITAST